MVTNKIRPFLSTLTILSFSIVSQMSFSSPSTCKVGKEEGMT